MFKPISLYLLPILAGLATAGPMQYQHGQLGPRQAAAPPATCQPVIIGDDDTGYQVCSPTGVPADSLKAGPSNNIWGGETIDDGDGRSINRYTIIYTDTNEVIRREDFEVSVFGTRGMNLRITRGSSYSQSWTIETGASISAEGLGASLSISYEETYTTTSEMNLSCDVEDEYGVMVVQPFVNHQGGYVYVTDNVSYLGGGSEVIQNVYRWDTDIPQPRTEGFIDGVYTCCNGPQIPFPCCYGSCVHSEA